jgi:hypothetical protein
VPAGPAGIPAPTTASGERDRTTPRVSASSSSTTRWVSHIISDGRGGTLSDKQQQQHGPLNPDMIVGGSGSGGSIVVVLFGVMVGLECTTEGVEVV